MSRGPASGLAVGERGAGTGFWLGGGRWVVPAKNPAAHSLLTVQMAPSGGAVQQLVAQGHTVPLGRPFSGTSAPLLADQLDKTGLCCGLVDKAQLQCAKDHPSLQHCVETLDGVGDFGWNEAILASSPLL